MTSATTPTLYRKNVAIVVLNDVGNILTCRRSDHYKTWQLPQGGVDGEETIEQTCLRELREEIGTDRVEVLGQLSHSLRYEWPAEEYHRGFRGQEQYYFLVRLLPGVEVDLSQAETAEFESYCWCGMGEFLGLISGFKSDVYRQALAALDKLYPDVIAR